MCSSPVGVLRSTNATLSNHAVRGGLHRLNDALWPVVPGIVLAADQYDVSHVEIGFVFLPLAA